MVPWVKSSYMSRDYQLFDASDFMQACIILSQVIVHVGNR